MVLKYYNFFVSSILPFVHINLSTFSFVVPLGISFYTFSLISYNVDTCRRENDAETNPLKFLLYVSYFPRIIQGPISSYKCLSKSNLYAENKIGDVDYGKAFLRISIGLVKKIAIANVVGLYVDAVYGNIINTSGIELALITIFYSIQLYADFSGFMDIVIGVSSLFGIKLEENFNIPYISSSIQEFWRRWHITLGAWLKKYIYIPLGGSRVKIWRWIINIFVVWFISGFWHGAQYTYIAWGLIFGALIVLEGLPKQIRKSRGVINIDSKRPNIFVHCLKVVITFLAINFTWIFFRSPSLTMARLFIKRLVKIWEVGSYSSFMDTSINKANSLLIVSLILILVLIIYRLYLTCKDKLIAKWSWLTNGELIAKYVITIAFVSISLFTFFYMKSFGGSSSSFIYFEF